MGANSEQHQQAESTQAGQIGSELDLVFETEYEYGSEADGLTVVILDALADELGVSPTEIVPQISESVDPDALERVLRPLPNGDQRRGTLTFYLMEYRITVNADGTVRIFEAQS